MKRFLYGVGAIAGAIPGLAFAEGDVWSSGTTAITTAGTNVAAMLIAALVIPVGFLGFKVVKRVLNRA